MIKHDRQIYFNRVKGVLVEVDKGEEFSSITLKVGHSNTRHVNLCFKKVYELDFLDNLIQGQNYSASFYVSSNKKNGRWYTNATLLKIERVVED